MTYINEIEILFIFIPDSPREVETFKTLRNSQTF